MSNLHKCETLNRSATEGMEIVRLRVPGGWIYYAFFEFNTTATFVPEVKDEQAT